jgi:iron(III) transport system ATP-binding protein
MERDEMSETAVLALENVSHAYDRVRVIDDVSFTVAPGELVGLLGPSGSGKTTLLRLAAGLEELQAGRIVMNGQPVADGVVQVPPEMRGVGLVFQEGALFPHLTVVENVAFGLAKLKGAEKRGRALEVLDQVGMTAYGESYPHVLSGGQQQRVALARALAPAPRLLLLDEPFTGLDAKLRSQIRDETLHILKDTGTTTLIVTHDPEEAMYMADRIILLNDGSVAQLGAPDELYCHPASVFVTQFFSSTNRIPGVVKGNSIETPFGLVAAGDMPDGAEVDVLIRPEAVRVTPLGTGGDGGDGDTVEARVITARRLRRASFIHLCIGDFEGEHLHFHSRVPARFLPGDDETVSVRLDHSQIFVFPADEAG